MEEIIVKELTSFTPEIADRIRELCRIEGKNYKELADSDLQEILSSPTTTLFVALEERTNTIAGMVTLVTYRIPYVRKAYLEDIVVDEAFRGRGIGKALTQKVIDEAKKRNVAYLDLTTRPRREEGNNLYEKMGFQKRDTNVFRYMIDYGEL